MAITKTRNKIFNSFEAEELWLNEQAESGWRLIDYSYNVVLGSRYTFEVDLSVREMCYKIDFRTFKNEEEFENYKAIYQEAGWNLVTKNYRSHQFIFISKEANEIFTDSASLIKREKNRRKFVSINVIYLGLVAFLFLLIVLLKGYKWLISPTIIVLLLVLQQAIIILKCNQAIKNYK